MNDRRDLGAVVATGNSLMTSGSMRNASALQVGNQPNCNSPMDDDACVRMLLR
jgi:hypothetical protein